MESLLHDIRFALRTLLKSPGFTAVAVLTLALGIGATTAIFSIVNGIVLRPLPYTEPDRLVMVWEHNDTFGRLAAAWTNFLDWRTESRSFEAIASFRGLSGTVLGGDEALRAGVAPVSDGFFRVMDVEPVVGRVFGPDEHVLGAEPASMISHSFWQNELAGEADLGELRLVVGGFSTRVIGVLPEGFDFPAGTDVWYPLELSEQPTSRTSHNWRVIGRLAAGIEPAQAEQEVSLITSRFAAAGEPDEWLAQRAMVTPLRAEIAGPVSSPLFLLMGASLMVVLVGCTNLASTLLARGSARGNELAVLRALGAERGRIVRRLFTESLLLALFGAAAGLLLAVALIRSLPLMVPSDLPRMAEIGLHPAVAGFTVMVSIAAALLFGLFPALRASDADIAGALRRSGRSTSAARSRNAWRLLVVGEVALALLLLAGAGLLMRSFWSVLQVDGGFESGGVITARVSLPASKYGEAPLRSAYFEELLSEVRALPGVETAGMVTAAPLSGSVSNGRISVDGGPQPTITAAYQVADAGYFETLGIPLLQGRLLDAADNAAAAHVVVINRALADLAWPGEDPIGKRITGGGMDNYWEQPDGWATVVGVVGDVLQRDLTGEPEATFYFSFRQRAYRARGGVIVVRATGAAPTALVGPLRQTIRDLDADVPVEFSTMDEVVARSLGDRRFVMGVLGAFAAMALLLAALGIYGVVGYTVALRTREMGIRIALGSAPVDVLRMVMGEAMTTVAIGLAVGVAGTLALSRVLGSLLFEVSPADPIAIAGTAFTLLTVAAAASFIPARRAATIDPLITMRAD